MAVEYLVVKYLWRFRTKFFTWVRGVQFKTLRFFRKIAGNDRE